MYPPDQFQEEIRDFEIFLKWQELMEIMEKDVYIGNFSFTF